MYIAPDSDIKILHNVPLDTTYQHTIFFSSASDQSAYFSSQLKYNLTDYSYQRVNKGSIKVGIKADNLYDCNYIMFRNTAFGQKWFYAFITSVEYVNNITSEITYELDVMQTWFFDYTLKTCFVEREHTTSDAIGANIVPENLDTGELVFNSYGVVCDMSEMRVLVGIVDIEGGVKGKVYDGVYGGAALYAFKTSEYTSINSFLQSYIEKPETIVSMYLAPAKVVGNYSGGAELPSSTAKVPTIESLPKPTKGMKLDGYTPKNNKLYTYPYCYASIDNASGSEIALRYEFSNAEDSLQVAVLGTITSPVTTVLRPINYKNASSLKAEQLVLNNYPKCSWNYDGYQAWEAQNSVPMVAQGIGGMAISGALALATGSVAPLVVGGIRAVSNLLSQQYPASIQADVTRGQLINGNVNIGNLSQSFYGGMKCLQRDYARMVDDYFTVYGYAVKRVKLGNRNTRPHWNYLKTVDCVVTGSVPADDMRKICSIYDKGVTFWNKGKEVGNYSLDNSV